MSLFDRFSLRQRMLAALTALGLLLVIPAAYSLVRLHQVQDIAVDLNRHASAWAAVGDVRTALGELDQAERSYLAAPDSASRAGVEDALARVRSGVEALRTTGYVEAARETDDLARALTAAHGELQAMVEADSLDRATALFQRLQPLLARARSTLQETGEQVAREAEADVRRSEGISAAAGRTTLLVLLAAVLVAGLLGLGVTRSMTAPVLRLREALNDVAEGDFQAPENLDYRREDELGDLARSFRWMTGRLRELSRMRADLISTAGHKLKTPLNVIRGYAEMLRDGVLGPVQEEQAEVLQEMEEQTLVLAGQVDRLMELARAEAGALRIDVEPVRISDILQDLREVFEPQARQKRIEFSIRGDGGVPRAIEADAERLRDEVLGNFLSNAFKFTGSGGRVELRAASRDGGVVFEVRDSGRGIPEDELEHVFEKYHQASAEARSMGSGLGLAIAREIVRDHGGEIWAESESGEGATFGIWIPREQQRGSSKGPAGAQA